MYKEELKNWMLNRFEMKLDKLTESVRINVFQSSQNLFVNFDNSSHDCRCWKSFSELSEFAHSLGEAKAEIDC